MLIEVEQMRSLDDKRIIATVSIYIASAKVEEGVSSTEERLELVRQLLSAASELMDRHSDAEDAIDNDIIAACSRVYEFQKEGAA